MLEFPLRRIALLDKGWRFCLDMYDKGEGYQLPGHDDSSWREVEMPACADLLFPELSGYRGGIWLRRSVVNHAQAGETARIAIGAVAGRMRVYVDGKQVLASRDSFLPIEFDLPDDGGESRQHLIALYIDSTTYPEDIPGPRLGWEMPCGVLRPITLAALPAMRLGDIAILAEPAKDEFAFNAKAQLVNASAVGGDFELACALLDKDGQQLCPASSQKISVKAGETFSAEAKMLVKGAACWSPESPNLYAAVFTLKNGGKVVDVARERFGFRSVRVQGRKFLLNGKPVMMRGFNKHEDSPARGMMANPAQSRADLEAMKRMGCNFIRLAHYPHDPATLDICDELGLLVLAEVPVYWWSGKPDEESRQILEAGKRQIEMMLRRDRNHPSIVIWSVSNETSEHVHAHVREGNDALMRHAKACDPSRLVTHVSTGSAISAETSRVDDIICPNDYPGIVSAQKGGWNADYCRDYWRDLMAKIGAWYPDKPLFVTEFGYSSLAGLRGGLWGETRQCEVLEAEFAGIKQSEACGCVIWCWSDHPWPKDVCKEGLRTSTYGVLTRARLPKAGLRTAEKIFGDAWFK